MIFISNRWLLYFFLLFSMGFWFIFDVLLLNSIFTFFKAGVLGSVSINTILYGCFWIFLLSCLFARYLRISLKFQFIGVSIMFILTSICIFLYTGILHFWFYSSGLVVFLLLMLIEVTVAERIVDYYIRKSLPLDHTLIRPWFFVIALVWLTAAKAVILIFTPGITIRF
jgi:hypothetical protein